MPVHFPDRKLQVAMSRIGTKCCDRCNSEFSTLEAAAKTAYENVRDGKSITVADAEALLNWLDKVRVGIWLWMLDVGRGGHGIEPKFSISTRIAYKDRIALIARYPEGHPMRGLQFWGIGQNFQVMPSVIGLLSNNIALVSISSDYLVFRHMREVGLKRVMASNGLEKIDLNEQQGGTRLRLMGSPYVIGQCVLPTEVFHEHGVPIASSHPGLDEWSKSPPMRLSPQLTLEGLEFDAVPLIQSNVNAHTALMELNTAKAIKFIADDHRKTDFSALPSNDAGQMADNLEQVTYVADGFAERARLDYRAATGIQLPN